MKEKVKRGIPVGIPTIILLLTVLGLAVFAVLSVRASYGELKRARSSAEALAAYYKADSRATEIEFRIAELALEKQPDSDEEMLEALSGISEVSEVSEGIITYRVPIADETSLVCSLGRGEAAGSFLRKARQYTVDTQTGYNHGLVILETEIVD